MWQPGDIVIVPYDDSADNQEIIGQCVIVVQPSQLNSPFWTVVEWNNKQYSVRGSELRKGVK